MFDFELEEMIQQQLVSRGIDDQQVILAFRRITRKTFVPEYLHNRAYHDERLPVGLGQTISPPYQIARMLQELNLTERSRVLEIGTGSGYQTALLAAMAAEIYTIEVLPELSARARKVLVDDMAIGNVQFNVCDGFQGWSDAAPFDAIVVNAAAEEVPWPLVGQLRTRGRLVMPVGDREQEMVVVERDGELGEATEVYREAIAHPFGEMTGEALE